MAKRYWLMKSEEDVYSIDDLREDGSTHWEGIRSYEARNNMQGMSVGDEVLYYHSNASPSGVAGVARVVKGAYPDRFAFQEGHRYHDPKSDPDDPRWYMVDIEFVEKFDRLVPLSEIKDTPELADMVLVNRMRLSVQPVEADEFRRVRSMGKA